MLDTVRKCFGFLPIMCIPGHSTIPFNRTTVTWPFIGGHRIYLVSTLGEQTALQRPHTPSPSHSFSVHTLLLIMG